jgi:replicative DNA helicase
VSFDKFIDRVLSHEGGYVNDPLDPGGETNWGVTVGFARANGYLGLMSASEAKARGREYEEISRVCGELKGAARSLRVPLIAVHQLNRADERDSPRRPSLVSLRGSGHLEQDAHAVVLLYRPGYYATVDGCWKENLAAGYAEGDASSTELMVAKQRRGKQGTCVAHFEGERTWFRDEHWQ